MSGAPDAIEELALDWVIQLRDPAFDDWETFEVWLGADARHASAYHAMAIADEDAAASIASARPLAPPMIVPDTPRRRQIGRRAWLGGALAASLVAVGSYGVFTQLPAPYAVETPAGARRSIVLADGTRIELNGGTRITLDRNRERYAVLDRGEAVFNVVHDDARPFRVDVGDATLLDAGTVFNVTRVGGVTAVAVAEGAVVFNPDREAINLPAGRALRSVDGETRLVVREIEPGLVAAWREGRLVYDGAPLEQVAADLSRNLGLSISASPEVAARPFRGVISIGRDRERVVERLGPLLDVEVRRTGSGWVLVARAP